MRQIKIFDTTLRDGEQSPGCTMNLKEKIEIAKCLEKLKVDVIEAGFAISSPGDFESVNTIAKNIKECEIASLARSTEKDIDAAWEAVKVAENPKIHLFIATSKLHMDYKLKMTEEEVLERIKYMTAYAKKYCSSIEFSAEDATRSELDFLAKATEIAIANGATVVNLPDTVGYSTPDEMKRMISYVLEHAEGAKDIELSVHCHNDLGMATANSLAGVQAGARQIECTINGLGERAGNTALEEVVMAMKTRADSFTDVDCRIDTTQLYRASKTVYNVIGQHAPLNKAIVGQNAFSHESGIHQHGVQANKLTYEIMTPESIGIHVNNIVLGKHSGKHAFQEHIEDMGYQLSDEELLKTFDAFKALCDKKKNVNDADIEALILDNTSAEMEVHEDDYRLDWFAVHTSNFTTSTSTVCLRKGDEKFEQVALGDGPVDAAIAAIDKIMNPGEHIFGKFSINSVSEGKDTLGSVSVSLETPDQKFIGRGLSTDVIEASIRAYINAANKMLASDKKARITAKE